MLTFDTCVLCSGTGCSFCKKEGSCFMNLNWSVKELTTAVQKAKEDCDCCDDVIKELEHQGFIISYPNSFRRIMLKEKKWH